MHPRLADKMTCAQRRAHVQGLRNTANALGKRGMHKDAQLLRQRAEEFGVDFPYDRRTRAAHAAKENAKWSRPSLS